MKEIKERWGRRYKETYFKVELEKCEVFKRVLNAPWHRIALNLLSRFNVESKRVLEVGCGYGVLSAKLAKEGATVVGMDILSEAIKISKEYAGLFAVSVDFIQGDAQHAPFRPSSFEFVVSCETLEHIPDYKKAIQEIVTCTKPLGHIIITVPNILNPRSLIYTICGWLKEKNKFMFFSLLKDFMQTKKVRILKAETVFIHSPSSKIYEINRALVIGPLKLFGSYLGMLLYRFQ